MKTCPENLIALGHRLADTSGDVIRRYFRSSFEVVQKGDDSPVTIADREGELAIRKILESERPQDGIIGEEFGISNGDAEYVWVLDPVDGTKSFTAGRPSFGTLIALLKDGMPVLGILNQPILNERWIGAAGSPTTFNGKAVRTRKCPDIAKASLSSTAPEVFKGIIPPDVQRLAQATAFNVYGGDCYMHGLLAMGGLDIVVEPDMNLHDYAALYPIVAGAGGIMTTTDGKRPSFRPGKCDTLACGDPALHELALRILQG